MLPTTIGFGKHILSGQASDETTTMVHSLPQPRKILEQRTQGYDVQATNPQAL